MASYLQKVGENVKKARKRAGMSQEELAAQARVDPKTVVNLERGKRNMTLMTLREIALALKISVSDLV